MTNPAVGTIEVIANTGLPVTAAQLKERLDERPLDAWPQPFASTHPHIKTVPGSKGRLVAKRFTLTDYDRQTCYPPGFDDTNFAALRDHARTHEQEVKALGTLGLKLIPHALFARHEEPSPAVYVVTGRRSNSERLSVSLFREPAYQRVFLGIGNALISRFEHRSHRNLPIVSDLHAPFQYNLKGELYDYDPLLAYTVYARRIVLAGMGWVKRLRPSAQQENLATRLQTLLDTLIK